MLIQYSKDRFDELIQNQKNPCTQDVQLHQTSIVHGS